MMQAQDFELTAVSSSESVLTENVKPTQVAQGSPSAGSAVGDVF